MNTKKSTTLYGTLIYPPVVGCCALIRYNGTFLRTSRIVAIHSYTAEEIRFETLNTQYTLLRVPHTAVSNPFPTCMAA